MRKTLLFAAVLCGMTSFAVEPVAVWNGDFKTSTKGDYTLSDNGNAVATDGSTITISTAKGVTFERSSALANTVGMTVIYKFDNLVVGSTIKTIGTASGGDNADRVGVNVQTSGQTSGIWANTGTYNTDATQTTISSIEKGGQFALVYGPSVSNNTGTFLYLKNEIADYTLAYSCGGLKGGNDTVQAMTVGGTRNNGGTFPAATGMVIKAVALFDQALTKDQIAAYEFPQKLPGVISLNICNGLTADAGAVLAETETLAGTIPANAWQNICNTTENNLRQGSKTGIVAWTGSQSTTLSDASVTWSCSNNDMANLYKDVNTSIPFLKCYYSRANQSGLNGPVTFTITGIPYSSYDVIVYLSGNSAEKNPNQSIRVNDSLYYGGTVDAEHKYGTYAGSSTSWGAVANQNAVEYGKNVIRVEGQTSSTAVIKLDSQIEKWGIAAIQIAENQVEYTKAELSYEGDVELSAINAEITELNNKAEVKLTSGATVYVNEAPVVMMKLICEGSITLSANEKPDLSKFDLSGVTGGVVRTWLTDAEKKGIGFNFASKRGPITTGALEEGSVWYNNNDGGSNDEGKNGTDIAMSSDGLTTITWSSANTYDDDASTHGNNSSASMVRGYLDDANGVSITVRNIPFAEYAVIIYASTDDPNNPKLTHKVVNDVNYTYDSTCSDVAKEGTDAWGQGRSSSTVAYGTNAIRVIEQTKGTLTITSPKNTSIKARGCISAIQIVPYSTFVAPTVTIASVTSQCSEDYSSNTITGTIADYDANSWEGDLTARVVVNSTVYESEAIKDNAFTIEVTGLDRETVYRTVLEVGYTEKDVFTAIATKSIALYQGERKFVWIASPFVIQEKTLVNEAQGLTISNPFEDPDYIDLCDSEFTVSISASEAVDAENDATLDGTEQGGVRIAQMSSGLKLQVIDNGVWTDFADAAVDTAYTLTVKFHYNKGEGDEEDATSVIYTLDKATKNATNKTDKLKVTEVFISDGTKLPNDLLGACQLDKAVIVDIEIEPGDEVVGIEADNDEKAQEIAAKLKVGISEAVAAVLTTAEQQEAYRAYFKIIAVKAEDGSYTAQVAFADGVESDIEKDIAEAIDDVVESFNTGAKVEIAAKPGLYYGIKRGDSLDSMNMIETTMATSEKVTITITKPDTSKSHFYRIIVSPTPSETK